MDRLRIELLKAYKKRYKKSGTPKYGTLNKSFTELELQHFLRNVPNDKFRLLFKYQAYLGLRIGEVTKLHISNIDFEKRELILTSEEDDMKAMETLGRIDKIFYDDRGDNYLNRKQFDALQGLGLKYELIAAPRGYAPSASKTLRK